MKRISIRTLTKMFIALLCLLTVNIVLTEPAHAASQKRYGYEDSSTVALLYFRGKNISYFALSFPLTCESLDTPGEFTTTFTSSSSLLTGGLNRRKQLSTTAFFEDGSGREVQVNASGNFRLRNPVLRLEVRPVPGDLEVCDPFDISIPLSKLRGR